MAGYFFYTKSLVGASILHLVQPVVCVHQRHVYVDFDLTVYNYGRVKFKLYLNLRQTKQGKVEADLRNG